MLCCKNYDNDFCSKVYTLKHDWLCHHLIIKSVWHSISTPQQNILHLYNRLKKISEPDDSDSFYRNIYTGQRPSAMWQCHMCTFRNHELLTKCEECEMPRILVGTSPSRNHDSGFGSFRDKNRKGVARGTSLEMTDVNEMPRVIDSSFPTVTQNLRSQSLSQIHP